MQNVIKHLILLTCFLSGFDIAQANGLVSPDKQSNFSAWNNLHSYASGAYNKTKAAAHYLFSYKGAMDIVCAYGSAMGITLMHELGHAITAKLFWGTPIDITLGAQAGAGLKPYLQLKGVKLGGFNPYAGYASVACAQQHPLQAAAMCAAGPVCGTLSSILAYSLLKKSDSFYLTKAATLCSFLNNSLMAALAGINHPESDSGLFVSCIKEYFGRS